MKRIHLFEFEDFAWFPTALRRPMTSLIVVLHRLMGTKEVVAGLIRKAQSSHASDQVVDLGSGSGGIMPEAMAVVNEDAAQPIPLLLTDLHPNPEFVRQFNASAPPHVHYRPDSTDATQPDKVPAGLRTMVNSFHHLPPDLAQKVLLSAQASRQPLLIYEIAHNTIPTIIWWLMLPISLSLTALSTLFLTPMSRPITAVQLIFTYLIPVIPLCYAWDGQASYVRMYAFDDVRELLKGHEPEDYRWEIEVAKNAKGKKMGTYVLGVPVEE